MDNIEPKTQAQQIQAMYPSAQGAAIELKKNLNIIRELAIADFRLKYHDSVLGYLWSMLNPLMMFAIYYFVFTRIFQSAIPYYPVFLLAGIISYAFFQDCTFSGMVALSTKAGMMKKIYFPKVILIVAASSTSILSYLINLCVLYLITLIFKGFTPLVLLTPLPILCLILFSMGVSFILATMYAYFRDMGQIWNVMTLMIFWVSPVVFNVENLPPSISTIVYFNPLTRIFVLLRHYLLYNYFDIRFLLMTILYSILTFIAGYFVFKKYQDNLPELF
jgi:ABC-type polysaccharide/polyol phosphate export permease